jgi:hypothetical protein
MNMEVNSPIKRIELVGLYGEGSGRSCSVHDCCGKYIEISHILRLKRIDADTDNDDSAVAYKAVLFINNNESCTVGFLPRSLIHLAEAHGQGDLFEQISQII